MTTKQKLKNKIFNNFALKILAVISAVILWLVVVNIDNPQVTRTISGIPISIKDEEVLESQNKVYTITSSETASVMVTGKRKVVDNLTIEDFVAEVSLNEMSIVNAVPINVTAKNSTVAKEVEISLTTTMMTLELEDVITETYDITVVTNGSPATGYVAGEITKGREYIKVTAPVSIHEKIDMAVVSVDISNVKDDVSKRCTIELYTANGKKLSIDDGIVLSASRARVDVDILKTKTVEVNVSTQGEVHSGYEYIETVYTPETITIMGQPEVVDTITQLELPTVDISDARENVEISYDILDYLPDGISLYGMTDNFISVVVEIEALVTKSYAIKKDNIIVKNIPKGYDISYVNKKDLTLRLTGLSSTLDSISEDDIEATIDLSDATEGRNTLEVDINELDNTTQNNSVIVSVILTKK